MSLTSPSQGFLRVTARAQTTMPSSALRRRCDGSPTASRTPRTASVNAASSLSTTRGLDMSARPGDGLALGSRARNCVESDRRLLLVRYRHLRRDRPRRPLRDRLGRHLDECLAQCVPLHRLSQAVVEADDG